MSHEHLRHILVRPTVVCRRAPRAARRVGLCCLLAAVVLALASRRGARTDESDELAQAVASLPQLPREYRVRSMNEGLSAFHEALGEIETGEVVPPEVPSASALADLGRARVILVADFHNVELYRLAFRRLLSDLRPSIQARQATPARGNAPSGQSNSTSHDRIAVGMEALPIAVQTLVDASLRGDPVLRGLRIRELLKYVHPWPVEETAKILESCDSPMREVLALGIGRVWHVPLPETADLLRQPRAKYSFTTDEYEQMFDQSNAVAALSIEKWTRTHPRGQVVALFGLAHVAAPDYGVPGLLRKNGIDGVVVVIPFLPELTCRLPPPDTNYEPRGEGTDTGTPPWHELMPSVYYPPYITVPDILSEVRARRRAEGK